MKKHLLGAIVTICFGGFSGAQISEEGIPTSFQAEKFTNTDIFKAEYQVQRIAAPNMIQVNEEDLASSQKGTAYRIGINIPVSYNMSNSGTWLTLPNGDRIWRLGINIPDAQALSLYFSEKVQIPAGGKLHAYNENHAQYVGTYSSTTPAFYAMQMIEGDFLTLEYFMPAGSSEFPVIEIHEIAYYYRGVEHGVAPFRDNSEIVQDRSHGNCEVDAMCSEADEWINERHSALRYTFVAGGTFLCSASIVNNTAEDCTPYVITANHCGEPNATSDFNNHVWYFNYQRPTCSPGNTSQYNGAQSQTMSGGIFRASSTLGTHPAGSSVELDGCDFVLAELETPIPTFYHAFYVGWNRQTGAAVSGVCFHHPSGDEKKISTFSSNLTSATYNGGWSGAHWSVEWAGTDNGHGITEEGSSGSGLLDSSGLMVGHLSGGSSFCTDLTANDLYGKFLKAWELDGTGPSSQLKTWLDPGSTGVMKLNGTYGTCGQVSLPSIANNEISIYPNPTNGQLTIVLSNVGSEVESIELLDITGRVVFTRTNIKGNVVFDLTTEAAGIYFVKINTPTETITQKVVRL